MDRLAMFGCDSTDKINRFAVGRLLARRSSAIADRWRFVAVKGSANFVAKAGVQTPDRALEQAESEVIIRAAVQSLLCRKNDG